MFFDLSSCVQIDTGTPMTPPIPLPGTAPMPPPVSVPAPAVPAAAAPAAAPDQPRRPVATRVDTPGRSL